MRLLIVGASGGTGRHLVDQSLDAGHDVTALVRDAGRLALRHDRLRIVVADVMRPETIRVGVHDAVLSTLGVMPEGADRARRQRGVPVCSEGSRHLIAAMRDIGARRIVVETAASVGESRNESRFGAAWFVRRVIRDVIEDKERQEAFFRASGLDWTFVRPVKLSFGPLTGAVSVGEGLRWSWTRVSRADAAAVMLHCASDPSTIGKALTVA
jgi:putative NADH-flavin reductase